MHAVEVALAVVSVTAALAMLAVHRLRQVQRADRATLRTAWAEVRELQVEVQELLREQKRRATAPPALLIDYSGGFEVYVERPLVREGEWLATMAPGLRAVHVPHTLARCTTREAADAALRLLSR